VTTGDVFVENVTEKFSSSHFTVKNVFRRRLALPFMLPALAPSPNCVHGPLLRTPGERCGREGSSSDKKSVW
jgi:hypothetical protein